MKRKILYITTSYTLINSSAAIRNNSLVKGLLELGYDVDVYTVKWPKNLHSDFFVKENNGSIHYTELSNLELISSLKSKLFKKKTLAFMSLRKLIKDLLFFPDVCGQWSKKIDYNIEMDYDVIVSSSDHKSSHFVGMKLKSRFPDVPWVQVWGDPWNSDINTSLFMKKVTKYYEKKLLIKADHIVYVSLPTHEMMQNRYPLLSAKMHYIPRGFYFENSMNITPVDDKYHLTYTGVISFGRNIFALLDVINKNPATKEKIVIDIYGVYSAEIEKKLKQYSFVNLGGSVDYENINKIYASSSALLYLSNKGGSTQIPGKLYDYMGTQKTIICLVEDVNDNISSFLNTFERCLIIKNDELSIAERISDILACMKLVYPIEKSFSPLNIAKQFDALFRKKSIVEKSSNIILLRSADMLPDPRVEKYVGFYKENDINYSLLGWNRTHGNIHKNNTMYFDYPAQFGSGVKNLWGILSFNCFLFKKMFRLRRKYSIIHACDLDTVMPALLIKLLLRKKVIFDVFDWYSDSRDINNKSLMRLISLAEKIAVNYSDTIILCDEERKKQIPYKISDDKIIILPNIPHMIDVQLANKEIEDSNKIHISYVGILGAHRGLEDLLKVVANHTELQLTIAGFGELEELVIEYSLRCKNIVFYGKLEYTDGLKLMAKSDIVCAMYYKTIKNHIYAAPNKYFEALFLGKPILTTAGTIMGAKTEKYQTGFTINEGYDNIENLLLNINREQLEKIGICAKKVWDEKYSNLWSDTINTEYLKCIR